MKYASIQTLNTKVFTDIIWFVINNPVRLMKECIEAFRATLKIFIEPSRKRWVYKSFPFWRLKRPTAPSIVQITAHLLIGMSSIACKRPFPEGKFPPSLQKHRPLLLPEESAPVTENSLSTHHPPAMSS
ncbi:hypothetical protein CEXT_61171 [Caerostris extrusa]|uniref:Uncharacterized protein n=1 Tax=Caerostris extrusa TaxID=172846 RepID=A0AAV4SF93_CAEEX|nr:hypothetical protein CEXT_61171 [Caerostris extrusa]